MKHLYLNDYAEFNSKISYIMCLRDYLLACEISAVRSLALNFFLIMIVQCVPVVWIVFLGGLGDDGPLLLMQLGVFVEQVDVVEDDVRLLHLLHVDETAHTDPRQETILSFKLRHKLQESSRHFRN